MKEKIVITMVMEGDETTLQGLKDEVIGNCARYLISATVNKIEEPKKELKIPVGYIPPREGRKVTK